MKRESPVTKEHKVCFKLRNNSFYMVIFAIIYIFLLLSKYFLEF